MARRCGARRLQPLKSGSSARFFFKSGDSLSYRPTASQRWVAASGARYVCVFRWSAILLAKTLCTTQSGCAWRFASTVRVSLRSSMPAAFPSARAASCGPGAPAPYPYDARHSFARSSGSTRSLQLFMESPAPGAGGDDNAEAPQPRPEPRDVFRRYHTKISKRGVARPGAATSSEAANKGLRRLRKSRSAFTAVL